MRLNGNGEIEILWRLRPIYFVKCFGRREVGTVWKTQHPDRLRIDAVNVRRPGVDPDIETTS